MAIKKNILGEDLNNGRAVNAGDVNGGAVNGNVGNGDMNNNSVSSVLGLSDVSNMFISRQNNNEVVEAFRKGISKAQEKFKADVKVYKLDQEVFELGYTFFVFALKTDKGSVYHFSALLEKTGRAPLEVKTIMGSMNNKNSTDILVTADAFDSDYYTKVIAVLKQAYKVNEDKLVSCEGVVVPSTAEEEITGEIVGAYAHDVLLSEAYKAEGVMKDITVADINNSMRGGDLIIDLGFNNALTINMLGRHIRSDFNVSVAAVKASKFRSLNANSSKKAISTISGFTEYIISEEMNQYTGVTKRVAEPMIIVNEFMGLAPTLNYALLGLVDATAFTNRATLRRLIIEKDAGPLNLLFNYGGEPNKYGTAISFKDPKANIEVVNDVIRQHIKPSPLFAIEVEEFGAEYSYMLPFAALIDPVARKAANDDIVAAAEQLTNSAFTNRIVSDVSPIYVPIGEFRDNNDEIRDLREIDTVFVAKHANEPGLIIDWIFSNTPAEVCMSATGKDPYVLKLEVIDKLSSMLGFVPKVTGRAVRVVLNAAFVSELVSKTMGGGYSPKLDAPIIGVNDYTNNLQQVAAAYASAAMNTTGLGVQTLGGGASTIIGTRPFAYR